MSTKKYLTSLLLGAAMTVNPAIAEAGGMSHIGNIGQVAPVRAAANCKSGIQNVGTGFRQQNRENNGTPFQLRNGGNNSYLDVQSNMNRVDVNKPVSITKNVDVNKPISISKNVDVNKPISVNKNIDINKAVTVNKNVDINKPISINKSIDNSKNINIINNIDNSKNIDIRKSIVINKGGNGGGSSQSDAQAVALAIASAAAAAASSSSSSATINFSGGANASSSAFGYSGAGSSSGATSYVSETPAMTGGDFGNLNVEAAVASRTPAQCTFQDTTVIQAIHAVCVSADHHEFPASHMVPDTWINSGYEGEVARCIPGSHLKVIVGKVMQSSAGMAAGYTGGEVLECGLHEAVRHYKEGVLKCAPALPVPDCTERTNLRKYGIGDMFFTYRAKVCLETHEEYPVNASAEIKGHETRSRAPAIADFRSSF